MRAQEVAVIQPLLDYLPARNDVRLLGPRDADAKRAPTVAVELDRPAEPVSEELGRNGIACWAGDFYAVRPLAGPGDRPGEGGAADVGGRITPAPKRSAG
jgi:selenocysteine lyase/cysteine desulfurase